MREICDVSETMISKMLWVREVKNKFHIYKCEFRK